MASVSAIEAKTRFGELLDRMSRGEEIVITRCRRPVARIIPECRPALSQVREAVGGLRALWQEMMSRPGFRPLTVTEIEQGINEGRR
jgi:prevent-host-death family protein